ncbi:MAG: hypothetical protein ABIR79_16115 [Candidatus Binatia bacterium]
MDLIAILLIELRSVVAVAHAGIFGTPQSGVIAVPSVACAVADAESAA